ncbi:MAG: phosphoribosyltransferase family protein [Thiotrichales bacterium]|nr:phosphoribosyltransferase family protein [Thiotrichales bacterium]
MNAAREELRSLVDEKCLTVGRSYTLSTGSRSAFYFDCKKAMLDGRCLSLIADAFLEEAGRLPRFPQAIGGLTMGADFIVAAVIQRAFETGKPLVSGSIVRKEQKGHGAGNTIENALPPGTPILVVDDVVTTGSSTVAACDAFIVAGYEIVGIAALVDRESGGCETLARKYGCPVSAIFRKRDFPRIEPGTSGDPEV